MINMYIYISYIALPCSGRRYKVHKNQSSQSKDSPPFLHIYEQRNGRHDFDMWEPQTSNKQTKHIKKNMSLSLNIIHLPELPKILSDTFILLWSCFGRGTTQLGVTSNCVRNAERFRPGQAAGGNPCVRNPRNRSSKTWATWNHPVCCGEKVFWI